MGKAEALMTPTPESIAKDKRWRVAHPQGITADEVRESIRRDAKRLLDPYLRKAQAQRGLTKRLARMKFD
jgi:hypothetical protein